MLGSWVRAPGGSPKEESRLRFRNRLSSLSIVRLSLFSAQIQFRVKKKISRRIKQDAYAIYNSWQRKPVFKILAASSNKAPNCYQLMSVAYKLVDIRLLKKKYALLNYNTVSVCVFLATKQNELSL